MNTIKSETDVCPLAFHYLRFYVRKLCAVFPFVHNNMPKGQRYIFLHDKKSVHIYSLLCLRFLLV